LKLDFLKIEFQNKGILLDSFKTRVFCYLFWAKGQMPILAQLDCLLFLYVQLIQSVGFSFSTSHLVVNARNYRSSYLAYCRHCVIIKLSPSIINSSTPASIATISQSSYSAYCRHCVIIKLSPSIISSGTLASIASLTVPYMYLGLKQKMN